MTAGSATSHGGGDGSRPRLAFIGWYFQEYGGMETRILAAAELAREAGFDVVIRTGRPTIEGSPTAARLAGFDVRSVIGDWQRTPRARATLAAARASTALRARRRLTDEERRRAGDGLARARTRGHWAGDGAALLGQVDVVHLFGPPHVFTIEALEAAHAAGTSTVYQSVHAVTAEYASIRRGFVGTCNLLDLILTSGPDQAADFAEHFDYQGATQVIQQWAYDIEAELLALPAAAPSATGTVTVGALSRLDAVKGLDVLIRALAEAAPDHPGLRLRIGGTGEEEVPLRDLARSLGVADRVELVGYVADRVAFHGSVDAFVVASRAEGGPVTGVEAMAAGRPIISTPVGAMPHRLAGGVGRLVDVDDVPALARALGELAASPDERARLGIAARQRYLDASSEASQSALLIETWTRLAERTRQRRAAR